ncbi:HD domain-containing phosphohydrolase [Streptomyces sp. 7N604]|uniref:HD domain-containing phosphohydrolase n=1 Tax=Streptomyces sp. 7N604 TaxID=3457415 RepID=UPI003FD370DA
MRGVPPGARAYILCAVLATVACAGPALRPGAGTPWGAVLLLALLYAGCEQLTRIPFMGHRAPTGMGSFVPVLLAGAYLLPPAAAALVAVPGALVGRVEQQPAWPRRVWHAARFALASYAAAHAFSGGSFTEGGRNAVSAADFPYALLPAAAGAVTFCLVLAALDGGILVTAERCSPRTAWRGLALRSLAPHLVHGLAGLMMAVLWRSPYGPVAALLVLLPMYVSCWIFALYHRERAAHQATIRALVQAVDIKDRYTRGHSERVGRASVMIARELGMDDDRIEVLRFAGILHDVGKLGVPTRLLRKDGPLTPEERRIIELHPEYGHEMVRGIGFLGEARAAILHHHERLDGRGYPYGLSGGRIPECARVVAVADAFDAMTSTRSYRRARPVPVAVEELRRCMGAQFDPRMVLALARAIDRHGWRPGVTADAPEAVDLSGNVPPPERGAAPRPGPAGYAPPAVREPATGHARVPDPALGTPPAGHASGHPGGRGPGFPSPARLSAGPGGIPASGSEPDAPAGQRAGLPGGSAAGRSDRGGPA